MVENTNPAVTKRQVMAVSAGLAFGSGCMGQDTESQSGGSTFVAPMTGKTASEESVQFNPYNVTVGTDWAMQRSLFTTLGVRSTSNFEYYPIGAKSFSYGSDELTIELIPSLRWHNGDDVTASDLVRDLRLSVHMGEGISNFVESAEAIREDGDRTVSISFDQQYNPSLTTFYVLENREITSHESVFGEYIDRFEDASTESAIQDAQSELGQFNWVDPEPHTNGPFELNEISTQGPTFDGVDSYPITEIQNNLERVHDLDLSAYPDDSSFDVNFTFYQSHNTVKQAMISDRVDGGASFNITSKDETEKLPAESEVRTNYLSYGASILFNIVDHEHADAYRDGRVRKAFAHIIDLERVAQQFYGDYSNHNARFSGLTQTVEEGLFDQSFIDSLTTYNRDLETAESLLKDAGFSKGNDWWEKPDGSVLTAEFVGPSSVSYYNNGFQIAAANLKEFGIKAEVNSIEGTTFFANTLPDLDYGLSRSFYSNAAPPIACETTWLNFDGPQDEQYASYLQEPHDTMVVEVPPIGEPDSEQSITIDVMENYDQIRTATDEEVIVEKSKELSWAFNQTVPKLPVSPAPYHWYLTHDDWWYPEADDPLGHFQPLVWSLAQMGLMGPTSK